MRPNGFLAVTIALGLTSACGGGGDHGSPLSPTPLPPGPARSPLSAETTLISPLSLGIVAVSPSSGPVSGGTPLTITGNDFAAGALVLVGDLPALDVVVLTSTAITAVTPPHAEGVVDVIVTNPDGESTVLAGTYTYAAALGGPPMVAAISPPSGTVAGGTTILISGSTFAEGATVTFGGSPATGVAVFDGATLTAIAPAHEAGAVDVMVVNPDGQGGTLPRAFTYVADQPLTNLVVTITPSGVTPKGLRVPIGSRVTFVNNDFRAHDIESDPHPTHTQCPMINEVGFISPGESKQTGVFGDERTCGYHDHTQDTNRAFRGTLATALQAAPMVIAVSPASGPVTGGTVILISGSHLTQGATVTFGGSPATSVATFGDSTLTAVTPAHGAGAVDVAVVSADGQSGTLPGAFLYVADQPPPDLVVTITPSGVSPKELQVPAGSRVTFVNNDSRAHDIESDPHPVHSDCRATNAVGFIRPGESKQTGVFEAERTCGYHDHNQSTNRALQGTIVVMPASVAAAAR